MGISGEEEQEEQGYHRLKGQHHLKIHTEIILWD
jgi:hypothetical protein